MIIDDCSKQLECRRLGYSVSTLFVFSSTLQTTTANETLHVFSLHIENGPLKHVGSSGRRTSLTAGHSWA